MKCDFKGNDLSNAKTQGEGCGPKCDSNPSCTHFTWTNYQGGTCWLKKGGAKEANAVVKNDEAAVCGFIKNRGTTTGGTSGMSEKDVFAKTIYAEARGEPLEGQKWVAWVIKNRARYNREYWGGNTIKGVCLKPGQFECWNGVTDIPINEPSVYSTIQQWSAQILAAPASQDPTGGADHYNNPDKEGFPAWTFNCVKLRKIGNHQFYKGP